MVRSALPEGRRAANHFLRPPPVETLRVFPNPGAQTAAGFAAPGLAVQMAGYASRDNPIPTTALTESRAEQSAVHPNRRPSRNRSPEAASRAGHTAARQIESLARGSPKSRPQKEEASARLVLSAFFSDIMNLRTVERKPS
jgi:hypothetical protein